MKRLRRKVERVRIVQRGMPDLAGDYAAEVIRCRRAMRRAVNQLQGESADAALDTLREALAETWWKN